VRAGTRINRYQGRRGRLLARVHVHYMTHTSQPTPPQRTAKTSQRPPSRTVLRGKAQTRHDTQTEVVRSVADGRELLSTPSGNPRASGNPAPNSRVLAHPAPSPASDRRREPRGRPRGVDRAGGIPRGSRTFGAATQTPPRPRPSRTDRKVGTPVKKGCRGRCPG